MRKIFSWVAVILIVISVCLWGIYVATKSAPDWHKGELYVALPPGGLNDDAEFELELATLFAQRMHLNPREAPPIVNAHIFHDHDTSNQRAHSYSYKVKSGPTHLNFRFRVGGADSHCPIRL